MVLLRVLLCVLAVGCLWPRSAFTLSSPDLNDARSLSLSPLFSRLGDLLTVTTSVAPITSLSQRPRDLFTEAEDRKSVHLKASSFLIGTRLKGEGELAYATPVTSSVENAVGDRHRTIRFGMTGSEGPFRYGLTYRSAGEAVAMQPDQDVREVWVGWQSGVTTLTTSLQELSNNVARDPSRPRIATVQKRVSFGLAFPSWPAFSLTYVQGSSVNVAPNAGFAPQRLVSDAIESTLAYGMGEIKMHATSNYSVSADPTSTAADRTRVQHLVSGSYSPLATVTLTSTIGLAEEYQRWSGQRLDTPSASLSMACRTPGSWHVTLMSAYSRTQSNDGFVDTSNLSTKSVVSWNYTRVDRLLATISLEAGYMSYSDMTHPERSTDNLLTMVHLKVLDDSWSRFVQSIAQ